MTKKPLNIIITGATGMVGEGVLHECLRNPDVASVLIINRKPSGVVHPKLTEIIPRHFAPGRQAQWLPSLFFLPWNLVRRVEC
jgi:uncharacterized protein YbjT (DUF2867 family)